MGVYFQNMNFAEKCETQTFFKYTIIVRGIFHMQNAPIIKYANKN